MTEIAGNRTGEDRDAPADVVRNDSGSIRDLIKRRRLEVHAAWLAYLRRELPTARIQPQMIEDLSIRLLNELETAFDTGPVGALSPSLRDLLSAISAKFAERGTTPSQTATFVLSLKHVLWDLAPNDPVDGASRSLRRKDRNCWSCRFRWCRCGRASCRCRSSARWIPAGRRRSPRSC
jgi:rsbT co-antagonist protein RsbR